MGQGVGIDSEERRADDSVAEVLKHGTLSVGFIGLAETLTALIGVHHGESEEAQQLGLRIVGHLRERMDAVAGWPGR
jgi:ribonucleoside-triphosphate reductase